MIRSIIKGLGLLSGLGVSVYLSLSFYLYLDQGNMIHLPNLPSREVIATPKEIGLEYEQVALTTADGIRLEGWFLPAEPSHATLLFFHGNAGNISHRLESLRLFHNAGLAVFIIDYRGYGNSDGKPSEMGLYRDAEAAWRYLTDTRRILPRDILLFGRSLGGAMAAYLAERHPALGLVLESTFTSIPDLAEELYRGLPVRALARYRYDTLSRLANIDIPVMVIHSPHDDIIPFSHGERLYNSAKQPKRFLQIKGTHNTGVLESMDIYSRGWESFVHACRAGIAMID